MKIINKKVNLITILVSFTVLISCLSFKNNDSKESVILQLIVSKLKREHYISKSIDDTFSKHIFKKYLNSLDYNKHFFTEKDINKLKKYETDIDNQINDGDLTFFDEVNTIFVERVEEAELIYKDILSKPFNFNKDETYETDSDKRKYAKNVRERKEWWRKLLKYQVLSSIYQKNAIQQKKKENNKDGFVAKSFSELEVEAREKILKNTNNLFERLNQLSNKDRFARFINAITESYDPHSSYYPPKDKENFDIQMSGQLEGIGATLMYSEGYTKVTEVVPGSPSWKQGELEAEDIILKVAQGNNEPVDIVGMRLDEAVRLIRGKKGSEVRLTVKKIDGTIKIIPIIRDIVVIEKTYAKSCIIPKGKNKYGYIQLPKFYGDYPRKSTSRFCSDDVEKELIKLKKNNVDGVILDLRNNGGGYLNEVVKMTGLFIKEGPIVQVKNNYGNYVLKDENSQVTYSGPLVVLVNSFSASASEILAAAIQDYRRGIIVGGANSTHGKGSVQKVNNLDNEIRGGASIKPLGAIKLTIQKYYRINGGATQLKGVIPDIVIPDIYSELKLGEKELEFALEWDKIKPSVYSNYFDNSYNLSEIKTLSNQRIAKDTFIQKNIDYAKYLQNQTENTENPLNYDVYASIQKKNKDFTNNFNSFRKEIKGFETYSSQIDLELAKSDSSKIKMLESFNKKVGEDYYIHEVLNILDDMGSNK